MAYRIPDTQNLAPTDLSDSSDGLESDDGASDWGTDDGEAFITKSLFDASTHPTAGQAIQHDEEKYGVNVKNVISSLNLDFYGSMRLINLVRRESLKPESVKALAASDPRLQDDQYLQPVIQEDPLLRKLDLDDIADETELGELSLESWSDDDEAGPSTGPKSTNNDAAAKELESARAEISRLRGLLQNTLQEDESTTKTVKGKGKIPAGRDDDTHYFDSYAENDIHEIMLKDTTRTISYAKFIMSNPKIFKGATVMDVGCGTGILSMLAAKAGAKHVYAIEASGLASKARENIKRNGYESVITVIQSKVENVTLPVKQVDVIISEWMGYMLLYESMLDSVLYARDQFLAPGGLMAPSQTRLVVSGVTCEQVWKDRVKFWDGVYGFDLTAMDKVYFDEGMVEVVEEDEIVTDDYVVRDINTHSATIQSLDFHSDFELNVKTDSTIRAFMTHFDTFFSPHGGADASHVSLDQTVDLTRYETAAYDKAVDAGTTEETSVSFTTGPRGTVTHWRQVVFLLRSPIAVQKGDVIRGKFFCRKSPTNSRELDVEIHWSVGGQGSSVQMYKVR